MEFKGTKSKWKVRHSDTKPAFNIVGTNLGYKYKIARCPYIISSEFDIQETKANAVLMSKAPEMLEMLQECIHILGDVPLGEEMKEWKQNAEQLIKEATMR